MSSVQLLSRVQLFATPWTAACQGFLSFKSPGACSNSCPLNQLCQPTISSSVLPFSSRLQSFPASGSFPSQFLPSGGQSNGTSASASVLPMSIQDYWLVWSPGSLRNSQESSSAPKFENINSSVVSLLYSPTLTSIHDYWETIALTSRSLLAKWCLCFLIRCLCLS